MQVTAFHLQQHQIMSIGGWRMRWERVSETQRIEQIREHRNSPWPPSNLRSDNQGLTSRKFSILRFEVAVRYEA